MPATFRVHKSFSLKGRGLVVSGQIASGAVPPGGTVLIPDAKGAMRARRITSVESGSGMDAQGGIRALVGLVLATLPLLDLNAARTYLVPGLLLSVSDPESEVLSLFTPVPDQA